MHKSLGRVSKVARSLLGSLLLALGRPTGFFVVTALVFGTFFCGNQPAWVRFGRTGAFYADIPDFHW